MLSQPRGEYLLLTLGVVAVFILRAVFLRLTWPIPLLDMVFFIDNAKAMGQGHFYEAMHYHYPPFYSFLIFILHLFRLDYQVAARLISFFSGSLNLVFVYLVAKHLFNRRTAVFAGTLWLFSWPNPAVMGYSEALFNLLLWAGLYLALIPGANKKIPVLLSGICMGLANLSKSEALLYFLLLAVLMFVYAAKPRLKKIPIIIGFALVFLLIISPYAWAYYHETGKFSLNPKSRTLFLIYNMGDTEFLYSLQKDNSGYFTYAERIYQKGDKQPIEISVTELVRKNFRSLAKKYMANLVEAGLTINQVCNKIFRGALIFLGLCFIRTRREYLLIRKEAPLYLMFIAATLAICLFDPWLRFFYSIFPIIVIGVAKGFDNLLFWLKRGLARVKIIQESKHEKIILAGSIIIILSNLSYGAYTLTQSPQKPDVIAEFAAKKDIAEWLKPRLSQTDTILAYGGASRLSYFLDIPASRLYLLPICSLAETVAYARDKKVKYLIIQQNDIERTPQLRPLFRPGVSYPGIKQELASAKPGIMAYVIYSVL